MSKEKCCTMDLCPDYYYLSALANFEKYVKIHIGESDKWENSWQKILIKLHIFVGNS